MYLKSTTPFKEVDRMSKSLTLHTHEKFMKNNHCFACHIIQAIKHFKTSSVIKGINTISNAFPFTLVPFLTHLAHIL